VAESFTGGRVVAEIIKNSGASSFVDEGVVSYSNESKKARLNVKEEDLKKHGAVSSMVAYEMAAGLLKGGRCDLAIATTGIAGPRSDDTAKPVGLNYIAVGMKDGVHTYRYLLKGSREEITETAKNTALFLAIKKLKSI
jgi:nicotinamide-nucleotide amidase